jgi:hypothetical protein
MEADDYFNAYRILSESNDILMNKLENLQGKPLIAETAFGSFPTTSPSIVCLAFSLELYIKDLHQLLNDEDDKVPHGHDILKLFKQLPEKIKKEIFNHDEICKNPFIIRGSIFSVKKYHKDYSDYDGFLDTIKTISDAFVQWRYSYERGAVNYDTSFAIAFIKAITSITNKIREKEVA